MRLTNALRTQIADAYREDHLKVPALKTSYEDFLDTYFTEILDAAWAVLGLTPLDVKAHSKYFSTTSHLTLLFKRDRTPGIKGTETLLEIFHPEARIRSRETGCSSRYSRDTVKYPVPEYLDGWRSPFPYELLSKERLAALRTRVTEYYTQQNAISEAALGLDAILTSCTTVKKLIDTFPEIEPYVPREGRNLPTVDAANLRSSIDKLRRLGVPPTTPTTPNQ